MPSSTRNLLVYMMIPLLWGITFPLIKSSLGGVDPSVFVFIRFTMAALFMMPLLFMSSRRLSCKAFCATFLLGGLNAVTFVSQTVGLETISPSQSAFITSLSVVFVPFISLMMRMRKITSVDFISAFICVLGVLILTGFHASALNQGVYLTLLCALSTAISIIVIQRVGDVDAGWFAFYQILFTALFIVPLVLTRPHVARQVMFCFFNHQVLLSLVFCSLLATVVALYIQIRVQRKIGECKAAIALTFEPVFASMVSIAFFAEIISRKLIWGGLLIFISILLSESQSLLQQIRKRLFGYARS